jgi:ATP-dependent DNA helicase RecQ
MHQIAFFDTEVSESTKQIFDIGCVFTGQSIFHQNHPREFAKFIEDAAFICGHNIISHDLIYLQKYFGDDSWGIDRAIDTLLLSPLLFPQRPYHRLVKDDKLQTDDLNNPVSDSLKAQGLFFDEVAAFHKLPEAFKEILYLLLSSEKGFGNFFKYVGYSSAVGREKTGELIKNYFQGKICNESEVKLFAANAPVSLAYCLALLNGADEYSITPPWVLKSYPDVERLFFLMRNNPCVAGCNYCKLALDPVLALRKFFGFSAFRSYGGEPLQQDAVTAAIFGKSVLAVFPTGGGKSITFQVPALMSGENTRALTVVISPLQSLMKDQVDNLEKKGIVQAVTINGLLDPIERSKAIERAENGLANLLYISPESLRSVTVERLLLKKHTAFRHGDKILGWIICTSEISSGNYNKKKVRIVTFPYPVLPLRPS